MQDDLISKVQNDVNSEQKNRDGIPQIAVGLFLIFVSILMFLHRESFAGIFVIIVPMLTERLRRRFTYPRIGYAKLRENPKTRYTLMWLIFGALLLGLVLYILLNHTTLPPSSAAVIYKFTLIAVLAIILLLLVLRYQREKNMVYIIYGIVIAGVSAIVWYYHLHLRTVQYIVFAFGLLNLLYGIIYLYLFIRKYPVLKEVD